MSYWRCLTPHTHPHTPHLSHTSHTVPTHSRYEGERRTGSRGNQVITAQSPRGQICSRSHTRYTPPPTHTLTPHTPPLYRWGYGPPRGSRGTPLIGGWGHLQTHQLYSQMDWVLTRVIESIFIMFLTSIYKINIHIISLLNNFSIESGYNYIKIHINF